MTTRIKHLLFFILFLGLFSCKVSLGADFKGVKMNLIGALAQKFDDNITFVKNNEVSDWISEFSAGIKSSYSGQNFNWNISATVTEHLFADNNSFNNFSQDVDVTYHSQLSQSLGLDFTDRLIHAEEPRSFSDAFATVIGRYSYYWNRSKLAFTKQLNEMMAWEVHYANDLYDSSSKNVIDSLQNLGGTQFSYQYKENTKLNAGYEYSRRDFTPGSSVAVNHTSVGFVHELNPQVTLELNTGADFIKDSAAQNRIEPHAFIKLTDQLNTLTKAHVSIIKRHTSNLNDSDLFDEWETEMNLAHILSKQLSVVLSNFYGSGQRLAANTTEHFLGASLTTTYEIKKDITLDLNYTYSHVTSDDPAREYLKNVVMLKLSSKF